MEFRLPALGEGIDSATVTAVLVKAGDAVSAGQPVIAVETDKAAMEVEADAAGTVEAVLVKPGDKLAVGAPVLKLTAKAVKGEAAPASGGREPPDSNGAGASASELAPSESGGSRPPLAKTPSESGGSRPPLAKTPPAAGGKVPFKLPALGEGIDSATVTAVHVKPGDTVEVGQHVLGVETDKAAMDVEADAAGTVAEVHVKPGDKVPVGQVVLTLTAGAAAEPPAEKAASKPATQTATAGRAPAPAAAVSGNGVATKKDHEPIPAGPATRRLARELGVLLGEVKGSGRGGRVTLDDVKGFVRSERDRVRQGGAAGTGLSGKTVADSYAHPPLPDFTKFGEVERKAVSQIRQTIARNLTVAWRTMPMVTQHDLADITDLEAGRKRTVEALPKGAPKITMTVLAIKAVVAALREFPHFNASYDMNAGELLLKRFFHVGIAVDTERGLVVPVIRDADKKSIRDLAAEMTALAEKARSGKLGLDEMRGGTFTITNLGGIGGTAFTPIVNYPEVAILGLSRSSLQPVLRDGQVVPRLMMPLSLTYDHRVIDGADGARFTTRLAQLFSDPLRLLMET